MSRRSYGILAGFAVLLILDSVFSFLFPPDFTYTNVSILWHFFLSGLLIFTRDKPLPTRVLEGFLGGMVYDGLISSTFPVCAILFAFLCLLSGLLPSVISTPERRTVYTVFLVFLSDLIPCTFLGSALGHTVSFASWFYHFELLTLIFSGLIVIGVLYGDLIMSRYYLLQSRLDGQRSLQGIASKVRTSSSNHPSRPRPEKKRRRNR